MLELLREMRAGDIIEYESVTPPCPPATQSAFAAAYAEFTEEARQQVRSPMTGRRRVEIQRGGVGFVHGERVV